METEITKNEVEVSPPRLADPVVAPEMEGVNAEEGEVSVSMKAEEEEVALPLPPPLEPPSPMPMHESIPQPMEHGMVDESMMAVETGEITITDQDVLFGRGGLTNRHIGNLRYRDIISIHRQDYVCAQKTEKPNVARRIVKAIRTGKNPGRFLRKGDEGKWIQVSDQEAAWKASQALREKSRWSSMKVEDKHQVSASAAEMTVDSTVPNMAQTTDAMSHKIRKAAEVGGDPEGNNYVPAMKRVKVEYPVGRPPQLGLPDPQLGDPHLPAVHVPTELSHIVVPPVLTTLGATKQVGAIYMLPPAPNVNSSDLFPKDEDVLFGRGGRTNHHPGNKRLREIVNKYRDTYFQAKKQDKPKVSKLIVSALRSANPPSRFMRMNEETTQWEDVGDKRAAEKVSQTLREKDRDAKSASAAQRTAVAGQEAEVFAAVAKAAQAAAMQAAAQAAALRLPKQEPAQTVAQEAAYAVEQATAQAAAQTAAQPPMQSPAQTGTQPAHLPPEEIMGMSLKEEEVEDLQEVPLPSPEKLAPIPPPDNLEIEI